LLAAGQHAVVAGSPVPTALVRSGRAEPDRVVLLLTSSQARRPTSAARLAAGLATRLAPLGGQLTVVSAQPPASVLAALLAKVEVVHAEPDQWLAANAAASDVLVVPGGRNGAFATARLSKAAATIGATLVVIADRESVAVPDRNAAVGVASSR